MMKQATKKQVLCNPLLKKGGVHRISKKTQRRALRQQLNHAVDEWFVESQQRQGDSTPDDGSADLTLH